MTVTTATTLDWIGIIVPIAQQRLQEYVRREGHKPTLRSLYYILLGEGVVPGTLYGYKKLSETIVTAKKAGTFPEDAFTDATRVTSANFRTLDDYVTPEEFVKRYLEVLRYIESYYSIPRWFKQDVYVVIWIEKATMIKIFETILQTAKPPRDIPVAVNRGNSGYQAFTERCDEIVRLIKKVTTDKTYGYEDEGIEPEVVILYFGDFDPSGDNMSLYLSRYLEKREELEDYDIRLERVTVNIDQIVEYDLPFAPQDIDTMQKLWADPNIAKFSKRLRTSPHYASYIRPRLEGNREYMRLKSQIINHQKTISQLKKRAKGDPAKYQKIREQEQYKIMNEYDFVVVEIDALAAKMQGIFKKIVLDAADKYFKQYIYDDVAYDDKHSDESLRELVRSKIVFKDDDPFNDYFDYLKRLADNDSNE